MKLKDFICLGTCIFVFGCGQAHPTTSRPGETQAAGQAVPNSNEGNDVNPETDNEQSSDADTTDTQDTGTQPTDPSIPAEDEDQNEEEERDCASIAPCLPKEGEEHGASWRARIKRRRISGFPLV